MVTGMTNQQTPSPPQLVQPQPAPPTPPEPVKRPSDTRRVSPNLDPRPQITARTHPTGKTTKFSLAHFHEKSPSNVSARKEVINYWKIIDISSGKMWMCVGCSRKGKGRKMRSVRTLLTPTHAVAAAAMPCHHRKAASTSEHGDSGRRAHSQKRITSYSACLPHRFARLLNYAARPQQSARPSLLPPTS